MAKKKGKMYECQAFFPAGSHPKKWKYVTDLGSFARFLSRDHSSWLYFNVYEKGASQCLKRFYPENVVPKTLAVLLLLAAGFLVQQHTFRTSKPLGEYPMKNTCNKTTSITSINGFNNSATNPTKI